jgi:hypothetical protein
VSADALAKLAASLVLPDGEAEVKVEERWLLPVVLDLITKNGDVNIVTTNNVHDQDWHKPFIDYFKHGTLPTDPVKRR